MSAAAARFFARALDPSADPADVIEDLAHAVEVARGAAYALDPQSAIAARWAGLRSDLGALAAELAEAGQAPTAAPVAKKGPCYCDYVFHPEGC